MKKIVKIFVVIILVLLIVAIVFIARNFFILKSIYEVNSNLIDTLGENYHYVEKTMVNGHDELSSKSEIFYKDGIYLNNVYLNNEKINIYYFNTNTDERKYLYVVEDGKFQLGQTNISEAWLKRFSFGMGYPENDVEEFKIQFLKQSFTAYIKTDYNNYIIKLNNGSILTFDKNTKVIKSNTLKDTTVTYEYKQNIVTDSDIVINYMK